jgi:hypothetical protein
MPGNPTIGDQNAPNRGLGPFPVVAISVVALTALLVVAYVLFQWWSAYHVYGLFTADVKDKLDSYKVQADDLQRLVSLLVVFSSLYALVLGVSSYLSAQGLLKQSEDNAKRIEDLRLALEESFPFLLGIGGRMNHMRESLDNLMPDSDERDDYYDRLSVADKLQLAAMEQSAVSWFYFLNFSGSGSAEMASDIYRNFGKYYGARYKQMNEDLQSELKAATQLPINDPKRNVDVNERSREVKSLADRANFFLSSAIEKSPNQFLAYNDFAYLTQDIEGTGSSAAENFYRTSIRLEPKQQRAYYNLAIIEHSRTRYAEAEELSSRALNYSNWQIRPNPEREDDVRYNRACYRSHLGANLPKEEKKWGDGAEEDLRQVCNKKDLKRFELLTADCKPSNNGDLEWFALKRPKVVIELKKILSG